MGNTKGTKDVNMNTNPQAAQDFAQQAAAAHRQPVTPKQGTDADPHPASNPDHPWHKEHTEAIKSTGHPRQVGINPLKPGSLEHTKPENLRKRLDDSSPLASAISATASSVRAGAASLHTAAQTGARVGRKVAEGTVDAEQLTTGEKMAVQQRGKTTISPIHEASTSKQRKLAKKQFNMRAKNANAREKEIWK